jgi:hypothetical protein
LTSFIDIPISFAISFSVFFVINSSVKFNCFYSFIGDLIAQYPRFLTGTTFPTTPSSSVLLPSGTISSPTSIRPFSRIYISTLNVLNTPREESLSNSEIDISCFKIDIIFHSPPVISTSSLLASERLIMKFSDGNAFLIFFQSFSILPLFLYVFFTSSSFSAGFTSIVLSNSKEPLSKPSRRNYIFVPFSVNQ